MAYLIPRRTVDDRLRLSPSSSYRLIRAARGALVSDEDVVRLLNLRRNGAQPPVTCIPSDILRPDEAAGLSEMAASGVSARRIVAWTRRGRDPAPAWHLTRKLVRIPRAGFLQWIAGARP